MTPYNDNRINQLNDIRILVLHPGCWGLDITCHLHTASLQDAPPYEAISYAWGDPRTPREISCANETIRVTESLFEVLWHLRYPRNLRVLWVDAICINQQDVSERSHQVGLVPQIYSRAERVLVWLGMAPTDFRHAFPLEAVADAIYLFPQSSEEEVDEESVRQFNWVPFVGLLQRPYFWRKWIIPEILNGRQVMAICGRRWIPWDYIEHVCHSLVTRDLCSHLPQVREIQARNLTMDDVRNSFLAAIHNVSAIRLMRRDVGASLTDLLVNTRSFRCSDPRDLVFAIVGLLQYSRIKPVELRPDYRAGHKEVFKRCTIFEVVKAKDLRILSSVSHTRRHHALTTPSWVPELDLKAWGETFDVKRELPFLAAGRSKVQARVSPDETALHIRGKVVDWIHELHAGLSSIPLPHQDDPMVVDLINEMGSTMLARKAARWLTCLSQCSHIVTGDQLEIPTDKFEAFWRTMMCPAWLNSTCASEDYGVHFGEFPRHTADHSDSHPPRINFDITDIENAAPSSKWALNIDEMKRAMRRPSALRRFFTSRNRRLGQAPPNAQTGDLVCMFFGGSMLYVLRPRHDGRYGFVGDCYLHGMMDGEAVGMQELVAQEFALY